MSHHTDPLPYESAAVQVSVTMPDGTIEPAWMSVRSKHVLLESKFKPSEEPDTTISTTEHIARCQDCTDMPCQGLKPETKDLAVTLGFDMPKEEMGCNGTGTGRRKNRHIPPLCRQCQCMSDSIVWQNRLTENGVDYNDPTVQVVCSDDQYFFDSDDLAEWLWDQLDPDNNRSLRDIELYVAKPHGPSREFSLAEYLCDYFPEDYYDRHPQHDFAAIDKAVNDYIKSLGVLSWIGTNIPIKPESLRHLVDICPHCELRMEQDYSGGKWRVYCPRCPQDTPAPMDHSDTVSG